MKKVECIIRPAALPDLEEKLTEIATGMTVTHVKGFGTQKGETKLYRGTAFKVNMLAKIKVEVVVADDKVKAIVNLLQENCRTGEIGDGKIFVIPVEEAYRIRTGEKDELAL